MKLICVNNKLPAMTGFNTDYTDLTIGKVYTAVETFGAFYILNDNGHYAWYLKEAFMPLDEHRAKQISEIL